MAFLLRISRWIDRLSEGVGWLTLGLTLVMVVVGGYNAITRYLGQFIGTNLSSNLYIEVQWYLFSLIFLLGASYVLKQGAHVRVDILYSRLSTKGRAWVDLVGSLLLLLPMCFVFFYYSFPTVVSSWRILEQSSDASGLPRYPIKTAILVAFFLLGLQGVSEIIKQIAILTGHSEGQPQEVSHHG
ncbi:C4-dicarboxylate ABC transporter substrate-binding protein [filamentous cyanobacterium CCP5]|nr:C4-dicarboxylate ABC transporter substrate-binding protein [filamentous cyanobacterium CCP5]